MVVCKCLLSTGDTDSSIGLSCGKVSIDIEEICLLQEEGLGRSPGDTVTNSCEETRQLGDQVKEGLQGRGKRQGTARVAQQRGLKEEPYPRSEQEGRLALQEGKKSVDGQ